MVLGFVKNGRNITNIFSINDELINNISFFNRFRHPTLSEGKQSLNG